MKHYFLFFLTLIYASQLLAQTEPSVSLNMFGNDNIAQVNVNEKAFVGTIGSVTDLLKTEFKKIENTQKIALLLTYHKEGKPSIEFYSNPKLSNDTESTFLAKLMALEFENTKLVDFPLLITLNVKEDEFAKDFPKTILPDEKKVKEYESADLKKKYELNKIWAINEVLPVLSAYQTIVDDKFVGVKNFGNLISQTNFNTPQDINALTSYNSDYWRATMEMGKGNQLIPVTKIFMLISQGELDYAYKYIEMFVIFSDAKTISSSYLNEAKSRLKLFNKQLNDKINDGIKEHDNGKYENAIATYNSILKEYPNSAWAKYERYYSQNAIDLKKGQSNSEDRELWDKSKAEIYRNNPLYNMDVRASNGTEAYLLFRRQEIGSLFKKNDELLKDVFKYANIALDLKIYDFAAQLFWLSLTYDKDGATSLMHYLYCLEQLNVKKLKDNFERDYIKEFKKIEDEKENEMKTSKVYNSFKN